MATHQEMSGRSDAELLQRMVTSHLERYGETFWEFFTAQVQTRLPSHPVVMDLGCGPGLFLRDVAALYSPAALYGYDITPAMLDHARQVTYNGVTPTLAVHNLLAAPLPVAAGTVHLVTMTAVLHVLDDPLAVLAEIRRVLAPGGIFFSMTGSAHRCRPIWLHAPTGQRPLTPIVCAGFASFPPTISTP